MTSSRRGTRRALVLLAAASAAALLAAPRPGHRAFLPKFSTATGSEAPLQRRLHESAVAAPLLLLGVGGQAGAMTDVADVASMESADLVATTAPRVAVALALLAASAAAAARWGQPAQPGASTRGVTWHEKTLREMTGQELYSVMRLRGAVFIVEQNCHYNDADSYDSHPETKLIWGEAGAPGMAAACARAIAPGVASPTEAVIGRVATRKDLRGRGLGREVMRRAVEACDRAWPGSPIRISAETYLTDFYRGFGFEPVGAPFLDGAVMCVTMDRPAARGVLLGGLPAIAAAGA